METLMTIGTVIAVVMAWYSIGLLGSYLAMKNAKYLNWNEDSGFALAMAFLGPMNLLAGIICYIMWGLDKR